MDLEAKRRKAGLHPDKDAGCSLGERSRTRHQPLTRFTHGPHVLSGPAAKRKPSVWLVICTISSSCCSSPSRTTRTALEGGGTIPHRTGALERHDEGPALSHGGSCRRANCSGTHSCGPAEAVTALDAESTAALMKGTRAGRPCGRRTAGFVGDPPRPRHANRRVDRVFLPHARHRPPPNVRTNRMRHPRQAVPVAAKMVGQLGNGAPLQ